MNLSARSACKETKNELSFKAFTTWILFHPFVLCLFLFLEHKVTVTGGGGEPPPTFLEENCFCLSIRHMLKAEYLSFYTLSRLRFLEKYLIENVANAMSEPPDFKIFLGRSPPDHPLPPKKLASPARVFKRRPQLKLRSAVPAIDSLWVFPTKSKS